MIPHTDPRYVLHNVFKMERSFQQANSILLRWPIISYVLLSLENLFLSNYGSKDSEPYIDKGSTYNIDKQLSSQTSISGLYGPIIQKVEVDYLWNQAHTFHILKIKCNNVSVKVIFDVLWLRVCCAFQSVERL